MFQELPRSWTHVAAVRCPTLLVRGARSPIVLDDDVTRYRELLPGIRVALIPDAGHNIHGQQPAALGLAITSFLEGTGWSLDGDAP
jgi:pimeloyl-ACP methyl ester carboxylesterase